MWCMAMRVVVVRVVVVRAVRVRSMRVSAAVITAFTLITLRTATAALGGTAAYSMYVVAARSSTISIVTARPGTFASSMAWVGMGLANICAALEERSRSTAFHNGRGWVANTDHRGERVADGSLAWHDARGVDSKSEDDEPTEHVEDERRWCVGLSVAELPCGT